ncbi:uncharacterized protein [Nicotiana tomentosiformis]|uniref:uncharacterized protein n=1 Tax=Nicotiana tomentosiformis TaxID=4098 RepID=UPI00388CABA7
MVHTQERGEREAKRPRGPGDFSGVPSGGQFYRNRGRPYRHAQMGHPVHCGASSIHGLYSSHQGQSSLSALPAQSSSRAPSVQGSFAPGASSSYFGSRVSPIRVCTPVGDTIIVDRVYRSCVVTIGGLETRVDLLLLSMDDFDAILDRDWLSPCHAILDCHVKTVMLAMPGLPKVERRGSLDHVPSRVISYLKAQRMIGNGCLSYLALVRDVDTDTPTIDSVPVVRDFPDVFHADLPGMLPNRNIDFSIDLESGTHPISVHPYPMASGELKELKEQLQELLNKG